MTIRPKPLPTVGEGVSCEKLDMKQTDGRGLAGCLCCGRVAMMTTLPGFKAVSVLGFGIQRFICKVCEIIPVLKDVGCFHRSTVYVLCQESPFNNPWYITELRMGTELGRG